MATTTTDRARQAMSLPAGAATVSDQDKAIAQRWDPGLRRMMPQLARAMPQGIEADQLARDILTALRTTTDLWQCTEASLWGAAMTAAQVGLRIGVLGHGWILPFENRRKNIFEAQWVLGYQGMIELAYRTDKVLNIVGHAIHSQEKWRVLYGAEERIEHEPIFLGNRGEEILYYTQAWFTNGGYGFHVEDKPTILEFAQTLRSWRNPGGPWHKYFRPMALKTCLRRQWTYLPKTAALQLAMDRDDSVVNLHNDGELEVTDRGDTAPEPAAAAAEPAREVIEVQSGTARYDTTGADQREAPTKARRKQPDSTTRRSLIDALNKKYGGPAGAARVLYYGVLRREAVEADYVTSDELRAALALTAEQVAELVPDAPGAGGDPDGDLIDQAYQQEMAERERQAGANDEEDASDGD